MERQNKEKYLKLLRVKKENEQLFYEPSKVQRAFHESKARYRFIRSGNQGGKTFCTTHELAWILVGKHPYRELEVPVNKIAWVVGPSKGDVIATIWELYLSKFIPAKYIVKIHRVGGSIDYIEFSTGWKLYIKSYEAGRESMQMMPVDFVLVDEMLPDNVLDELEARVATTRGKIVYSFTPLKVSFKVKKYFTDKNNHVETFHMSRFDNPIIDKKELKEEIKNWDKGKIAVRIFGEWINYEGRLLPCFGEQNIIEDFEVPEEWRKICSIDPATSTDTGIVWVAENPLTGVWYVYRDLLVKELAPSDLMHTIIKETCGDRIYSYFVDQQAAYLVAEAMKYQIALIGIKKKNEKENMVNELNQVFKDKQIQIFKSCKDTIRQLTEYANQFEVIEFKPIKEEDHIVDCLLYFNRGKPFFIVKEKPIALGQKIEEFLNKKNKEEVDSDLGILC